MCPSGLSWSIRSSHIYFELDSEQYGKSLSVYSISKLFIIFFFCLSRDHVMIFHHHLILQDVNILTTFQMESVMTKTTMRFAIMTVEIVAVIMSTQHSVLNVNVLILILEDKVNFKNFLLKFFTFLFF